MKKKKLLKSASLIALSAVMMCGAATAFAGCGNNAYIISVSMFCGDTDVAVNEKNCNDWAKDFTDRMRTEGVNGYKFTEEDKDVTVDFSYQTNTGAYFDQLKSDIASGSQPDVFYVSPKYVKAWSNANRILDLSTALAQDAETLTDIWEDSLAFYGYSKDDKYTSGDRITYDAQKQKFVTVADGVEVGIYGLPKDYSNFGLGFNEVFFTDEVRKALTETMTLDREGVPGAEYLGSSLSYVPEEGVVTNEDGEDVPLVRIGVPTYYKPYNFYRYATFEAALAGGDPMATAVQKYTDGKGYCVTIPGWPGDTFEDARTDTATVDNPWSELSEEEVVIPEDMQDENATYDTSKGYITYTYAEYSALTWILTYYTNTFDWQGIGTGGCKTNAGVKNVYGNDQYDGVLYLLPWLAGNDAQYLDEKSTTALNADTTNHTATYALNHKKLNGESEEIQVQYGVDSPKFLETVGAFHAYGSDWNGNSNNAGDTTIEKSSGWDLFVGGNCVFYGVGTWNAGALNATDRQYLRYRLMPEPVSEDYALSSYIKDEDYHMKGYTWDKANGKATVTTQFAATEFGIEDMLENQILRQDQWGARMDSVGYGVSTAAKEGGDWRETAAIDLVKYLTITKSTQVTLTYSGSQLPNFKSQCNEFYTKSDEGDFKDMITPDDEAEWTPVYNAAKAMYAAGMNSATKDTQIGTWMKDNYPNVKYNPSVENDPLSSLSSLANAMTALYLVAYKEADRDLSLRMQYGLNATRDSAMYTYDDAWIDVLDPRGKGLVMAYDSQNPHDDMAKMLDNIYRSERASELPISGRDYGTPAWWCLHQAQACQDELQKAIAEENSLMS